MISTGDLNMSLSSQLLKDESKKIQKIGLFIERQDIIFMEKDTLWTIEHSRKYQQHYCEMTIFCLQLSNLPNQQVSQIEEILHLKNQFQLAIYQKLKSNFPDQFNFVQIVLKCPTKCMTNILNQILSNFGYEKHVNYESN